MRVSIALLEISAHGVRYGAKGLAGKLLVDHGHARRVLVVMPGEVLPESRTVPAAWK